MAERETVVDPGGELPTGDWIATFSGLYVTPLRPDPATLDIRDIAHSLANQCRFTGHVSEFYSTAQHSVLVSCIVPDEDRLWGLLHDASEAYIADIARPVKRQPSFGDFYKEAEDRLMLAVAERFGLAPDMPESVHEADNMLLRAEQRDLMPNDPSPGPIYEHRITPWKPKDAERTFLARYNNLTGERVPLPDSPAVLWETKRTQRIKD